MSVTDSGAGGEGDDLGTPGPAGLQAVQAFAFAASCVAGGARLGFDFAGMVA